MLGREESPLLLPSRSYPRGLAEDAEKKYSRKWWTVSVVTLACIAAVAFFSAAKSSEENSLTSFTAVDGSKFCISARNEKYDSLAHHTLDMYQMSLVLEPYGVTNVLTVNLCGLSGGAATIEDYAIKWSAEVAEGSFYTAKEAKINFADDVDDAAEVRVIVEPANARLNIKVHLTSVATGDITIVQRTSDVKVVRREIRRLTDEDREAFFEALHTVFTTDQEEGEALYGEGFTSHGQLSGLHNSFKYSYHGNLFFQTSHPAMQLRLDRSLRAVNSAVATPYWDFLIDADLGADWGNSIIYDKNWFGPVLTDEATLFRPVGRFYDVPRTYDPDEKAYPTSYHNVYGFLGGKHSTSKSPWMTRSSSFCGYDLQQGFSNCEHVSMCFAKFTESNRSFVAYDECMEHFVHANLHDMHAGMWQCQVDWSDYYEENKDWLSEELFSILAVKMAATVKDFVDEGWLDCPTSCDVAKDDFSTCACTSAISDISTVDDVNSLSPESVNDYVKKLWDAICSDSIGYRQVTYETESDNCWPTDVSNEHLDSLNRLILKTALFPGNYGDMASGAAANDPLFWVMHQFFDKAAHALRLSPKYNQGGIEWDSQFDTQGRGWDSETPFKYEDFEPNIATHDLEDTAGFLTNKMLWSLLAPHSNAIPYVYDQLTHWGGCYFDPMKE